MIFAYLIQAHKKNSNLLRSSQIEATMEPIVGIRFPDYVHLSKQDFTIKSDEFFIELQII
jgi:hypothetical protein